jgi:hypothetical protein
MRERSDRHKSRIGAEQREHIDWGQTQGQILSDMRLQNKKRGHTFSNSFFCEHLFL